MAPINRLFESVAASRTDGIAVILSGEGSDGADGARAVKVAGGVILAQNPEEAQHSGMPAAVIATGIVDIVASSSALAERLSIIASSRPNMAMVDAVDEEPIYRILGLLRRRTGHDFSHYKRSTVRRRISRRMQLTRNENLTRYAEYLAKSDTEVEALFSDMLISVTAFFLDKNIFETLNDKVIVPLFDRLEASNGAEIRA